MNIAQRLTLWHQTKPGLAIFAVIELAVAYVFLLWAVDSGSWLDWLCVLILTVGAIQNFVRLIWRALHHG